MNHEYEQVEILDGGESYQCVTCGKWKDVYLENNEQ
jgi:hypothetical protein